MKHYEEVLTTSRYVHKMTCDWCQKEINMDGNQFSQIRLRIENYGYADGDLCVVCSSRLLALLKTEGVTFIEKRFE